MVIPEAPLHHCSPESGLKGRQCPGKTVRWDANQFNDSMHNRAHQHLQDDRSSNTLHSNNHHQRHHHSPTTPCRNNIRWLLIGGLVGSAVTQVLMATLSSPSIYVQNVGYYDVEGAFHPLLQPNVDPSRRHLKLRSLKQKQQLNPAVKGETASYLTILANYLTILSKHSDKLQPEKSDDGTAKQDEFRPVGTLGVPDIAYEPIFINLPPPPKLLPDDFVSACLLIKDDNHWLIEWLAYHYHALPLRDLIVIVDPDSKTTPNRIFQRWTSRGLMNITVWTDKDVMPDKVKAQLSAFDNNTGLMMHRVRQTNFIKKCIPELKKRNAKFVTLIDTDEFVMPAYTSWYFYNVTRKVNRMEPGNVLRILKYHEQLTGTNHTCIYMPRYFFGAKESPIEKIQPFVGYPAIDAQRLITYRFIYRETRHNPNGKNLINLKRVPKIQQFGSVHQITSVCPETNDMWKLNHQHNSIIRVNHYLGTKEQHFFRDDPRLHIQHTTTASFANATFRMTNKTTPATYIVRGAERYDRLNAAANYEDQGMLGWVPGFVKSVGWKTAQDLLDGVGVVGVE